MKICTKCKYQKSNDNFYKRTLSPDGLAYRCKECSSKYHKHYNLTYTKDRTKYFARYREENSQIIKLRIKQSNLNIKLSSFNAYGGPVCACCGETELLFLSMDHINNDGKQHRDAMKEDGHSNSYIHYWLREHGYPPGFQVLCMNCQFGKDHSSDKTCPHKKRVLNASIG